MGLEIYSDSLYQDAEKEPSISMENLLPGGHLSESISESAAFKSELVTYLVLSQHVESLDIRPQTVQQMLFSPF